MRVAIHSPRISHMSGGSETFEMNIASSLIEVGHSVTIVTQDTIKNPQLLSFIEKNPALGIRQIRISNSVSHPDEYVAEAHNFSIAAGSIYKRESFDLILTCFVPDLHNMPDGPRYVVHMNGLPPTREIAQSELPCLEKAVKIICCSQFVKDSMLNLYGIHLENKSEVRYQGVGDGFFNHPTADEHTYDVCFVGRLNPRKGLKVLLDSLAYVSSIKAVIVGDAPNRNELEQYAQSLGVPAEFTGRKKQDEVISYIDRSKIFAYPVIMEEALGLSPLEAMARQRPVITTALGGMSEYCKDRKNCIVIPPNDPYALADAVGHLLDDNRLREELAINGYNTSRQFDSRRLNREIISIYEALVR